MKIQNHAINMSAEYFKVDLSSTHYDTASSSKENASKAVNNVVLESDSSKNQSNELEAKLTQAILYNVKSMKKPDIIDNVEISKSYMEVQELNYKADAYIETQDNQKIALDININLSRSFVSKMKITINPVKDPLIISLDGKMPTLSSNTFSFDIDDDGQKDQISTLGDNSAFLVLDKNNNRRIDQANELFGTKSGNGFKDLEQYDEDNNGWIDENDPIFDKLQVWKKTDTSNKLMALGEVGIGAIYLGATKTPFEIKSEENELLGQMQSSSFVLYENGKASVISQIDLVTRPETQNELDTFNSASDRFKLLNANEMYSTSQADDPKDTQSTIAKLKAKASSLQQELNSTSDENLKDSLRTQISAINAQIAAMLDQLT